MILISIKTWGNLRLSGDLSPVHGSHLGRLEGQDHGKQRNRHHQPWTVSLSILKHQQQNLQPIKINIAKNAKVKDYGEQQGVC